MSNGLRVILGVEAVSGTVFCVACANFIHDVSLESIRENILLRIEQEDSAHENGEVNDSARQEIDGAGL